MYFYLISSYIENKPAPEYVPKVFDNCVKKIEFYDRTIILRLWYDSLVMAGIPQVRKPTNV